MSPIGPARPKPPAGVERRDLQARARRNQVAGILQVQPQRLAGLGADVVDAIRLRLTERPSEGVDETRRDARIVAARATAVVDSLITIDDLDGARLAADLLVAVALLEEHLDDLRGAGFGAVPVTPRSADFVGHISVATSRGARAEQ